MYQRRDIPDCLASAHVLIVGAGALGCPAALALARAGVGHLTLVDPDTIELSNLQRQFLFDEAAIGSPKATIAARAIERLGPPTVVHPLVARLDDTNADSMIRDHDFVIDATDDPDSKLAINRHAVRIGRPACYGGVARTGGQMMSVLPGRSACLECVFPPVDGQEPTPGGCDELGILAPVAGAIGSLQALATVQALSASDAWRPGTMILYEVRGHRWRLIDFPRDPACRCCRGDIHAGKSRRLQPCHSSPD